MTHISQLKKISLIKYSPHPSSSSTISPMISATSSRSSSKMENISTQEEISSTLYLPLTLTLPLKKVSNYVPLKRIHTDFV